MYQVFVNNYLIYDTTVTNEEDLQIISPNIHISENEGGEFTFTLPKTHKYYNTYVSFKTGVSTPDSTNGHLLLRARTDRVSVYKDHNWFWEGCPTDVNYDLDGNLNVSCTGAYDYLEDVFIPLSQVINVTASNYTDIDTSGSIQRQTVTFANDALTTLVQTFLDYYNDRLAELESIFGISLSHKKIYFGGVNVGTATNPTDIKFPKHFARVCNFESVKDAFQKRILDDFGGYITIEKNSQNNRLELFYDYKPRTTFITNNTGIVYLSKNLLDYNISEDFIYNTSVIVRGNAYDEDHPGESKWWFKDERSFAHDLEQRAFLGWRSYDTRDGKPYKPTGGCRLFLDNDSSYDVPIDPNVFAEHQKYVEKYGFHECLLEYDEVTAKYPDGMWEVYSTKYPDYYISVPSSVTDVAAGYGPQWASIEHYMGYNPVETHETVTDDHNYISDYMKALRILGRNYLEAQQFGNMILEISATEINAQTEEKDYFIKSVGEKLYVSSSSFGANLVAYVITEINVSLDDETATTITLGGETTNLSKVVQLS